MDETIRRDARRYRRLQILGVATGAEFDTHLRTGTVMRFSNLDEFVDEDLKWHPSRGEAYPVCRHLRTHTEGSLSEFCSDCLAPIN